MTIIRRKTAKGQVRYGVRVDRDGAQVWVGTFPTRKEAKRQEAQARLSRRSSRMTCDAYVELFLENYKQRVKRSSYDTATSALRGFKADFRGIPLSRVSVLEAEKWALSNRWRMPSVVNLWNAAVRSELVDRNPFAGLAPRTQGRKRNRPLTVAEVDQLAAIAKRLHGDTMRALVLFLAYTGIRPGEAFALEWDDVDFEAMRVSVERRLYRGTLDLPKSNKARVIVLAPPARDALLSLDRDEGAIFKAKRGGTFSQSSLTWYWSPMVAAFTHPVDPYELRHFAAHHLYVTMGLPARVVAAQLGHDGPKLVEQLYGHGEVGALEEIDKAWNNVIPFPKASHGQ